MDTKIFSSDELSVLAKGLIQSTRVVGVKRKENKFAFDEIKDASELVMNYDVTLGSPKKYFQPPCEKLFDFKLNKKPDISPVFYFEPFVLFGVHTYDLRALNQMDKIWAKNNEDEHYFSRRRQATIIAIDPTRLSKWSFWGSMGATTITEGFDLLLTDIGGKYIVEIGSKKGGALISQFVPDTKKTTSTDLELREKCRKKVTESFNDKRKITMKPDEITKLIRNNYDNPIWETQAKKCYSCGSCNLVCPTCYCFDVKDNIELDLVTGERKRKWDGCLLEDFASVGSGENFRENRAERFRHRILRKTVFVPDMIDGELACVGCGRCSEACLPDITDPVCIINTIKEGK